VGPSVLKFRNSQQSCGHFRASTTEVVVTVDTVVYKTFVQVFFPYLPTVKNDFETS